MNHYQVRTRINIFIVRREALFGIHYYCYQVHGIGPQRIIHVIRVISSLVLY